MTNDNTTNEPKKLKEFDKDRDEQKKIFCTCPSPLVPPPGEAAALQ